MTFGPRQFVVPSTRGEEQEIHEHPRDGAQRLPASATCASALIEPRGMPQVKDELRKSGIVVLGSGMIRPRSLVMLRWELAEVEQTVW